MVEQIRHFIRTDQLWGDSQRPFCIFANGCTAGWDEHGLGIEVVFPYVEDKILPAVVLAQRNASNDYRFFCVTKVELFRLDIPSTMSNGTMRLDGDEICFSDSAPKCFSGKNPYMFRAFLWAGMKRQCPQELLIKMAERHLNLELSHVVMREMLIAALERCGSQQEKLVLWREYAAQMNEHLGANVVKYDVGNRPSAMFQLSRVQGHERDVDEVLERTLAALKHLGYMNDEFGVPSGALELLATKY